MDMIMRGTRVVALAFAMCASLPAASLGQVGAVSDANWTVLTIAPDGSWGAATEQFVNRAIVNAIARCRAQSGPRLGCGANLVSVQGGWALGLRCAGQNILASGLTLADAVEDARYREQLLRRHYQPEMASCRRIAVVDPEGSVMASGDDAAPFELIARR